MACETKNTELEGIRLFTTQFPATQGAKITVQLIKLFGPLASGAGINMATFTEKLDDASVVNLLKTLLTYTKIKFPEEKDVRDIDFETDFAGKYLLMYKTIIWVIQVNCFFGKVDILSALTKGLTKVVAEKLQTSSEDLMTK